MALKSGPIQGRARTSSPLAFSDLRSRCTRNSLNLKNDFIRSQKWECCRLGVLPHRAITAVEDETSVFDSSLTISRTLDKESKGFFNDLNALPKPLSAADPHSPDDGSNILVAYEGLPGAYSEIAAKKAFPECETFPCPDFDDAFKAVERWVVDKAVLPIENSFSGSIHRNYDLLLRHKLHIIGEVQLKVDHCLLGLEGVRKDDLKKVLSHPNALDQCGKTLTSLGVQRISTKHTAEAAQMVARNGERDAGAIASARAAEVYGLHILAEQVQDNKGNTTRFLILAREAIIPLLDKSYKTSVVFSLEEGPGVLFKALAVFSLRDIFVIKLESRPLKRHPIRIVDVGGEGRSAKYFDYLFYIDLGVSLAEPRAQYALAHLQEFTSFFRVFGCYPVAKFF